MSDSPAGKGDKNRLKGDSLKAYGESKLWDKKVECISCHKKVDPMNATYMMESKDLILCNDCCGCYTVAELWIMQDQHEEYKKKEAKK